MFLEQDAVVCGTEKNTDWGYTSKIVLSFNKMLESKPECFKAARGTTSPYIVLFCVNLRGDIIFLSAA